MRNISKWDVILHLQGLSHEKIKNNAIPFQMHVAIGEGVNSRRVRVSFRAAHAAAPRQQYYSVRALTLAARCLCHGHATSCSVDTAVSMKFWKICKVYVGMVDGNIGRGPLFPSTSGFIK